MNDLIVAIFVSWVLIGFMAICITWGVLDDRRPMHSSEPIFAKAVFIGVFWPIVLPLGLLYLVMLGGLQTFRDLKRMKKK